MANTLKEVFMRILDGKEPYPHQMKAAQNLIDGKSVILRAPCGSGKTEVSYAPCARAHV